jgi:hypothetical protein
MTKWFVALAMTMALAGAKDVTGTWNISLQGPDHVIPVGMELKQDGKTLTGKILLPTQQGGDRIEVPLTGDIVDGAFKASGTAPQGALTLEATLDEDGVLNGTISMGDHARNMKWTAERLKAKK